MAKKTSGTRKAGSGTKKTPAKKAPTRTPAMKQIIGNSTEPLIVTISGLRGIAGKSLTPASLLAYTDAFAATLKGNRVVLGHDARPSSKWMIPIIEGVLRSRGIDMVFVGMAPTPTVGLLVRKLKAAGGLVVTASHNPIEYNGLKFFSPAGEFIDLERLEEIRKYVAKPAPPVVLTQWGRRDYLPDAVELHLNALLQVFDPPSRMRASKAPKVIIDCCNSSGAVLAPDVADAYGAVFQMMFSDTKKFNFPREAEPVPENLRELRKAVVKEGADLGFAIDPDADRLAIVDEEGRAIGEERTLVLALDAYFTLVKRKSPVVVNLSTTKAVEDVAAKYRVPVYRSAIGEANVLAKMHKHKARIGGEGNGGVIVPQVQPGRDAATAIALILIGLQARGGTLSEWNASIPDYVMIKEKVPLNGKSAATAIGKIKAAFRREEKDTTDGVKVMMDDQWLHVRASNTEPVVRIVVEAPTQDGARELLERVTKVLG